MLLGQRGIKSTSGSTRIVPRVGRLLARTEETAPLRLYSSIARLYVAFPPQATSSLKLNLLQTRSSSLWGSSTLIPSHAEAGDWLTENAWNIFAQGQSWMPNICESLRNPPPRVSSKLRSTLQY
jgi:hypothetical protein